MAARQAKLIAVALAGVILAGPASRAQDRQPVHRIVSLVPALTEVLFAIGSGPDVVGVSSYDEVPAEVKSLPRVGALLDPDTERILSLRPDLVITYGSQTALQEQLERARIGTFNYRHGGIARTLDTIRQLGAATGRPAAAVELAAALQRQLDAVQARVRGRPRPRTMLVFGRQPGTLREIYASGALGFLNDMIDIAGGVNVFADAARESVQPSLETVLARAPDVILEVRAAGLTDGQRDDLSAWSRLSSVPAVKAHRVLLLTGDYLVVPGPRLGSATEAFARALHPEAFR